MIAYQRVEKDKLNLWDTCGVRGALVAFSFTAAPAACYLAKDEFRHTICRTRPPDEPGCPARAGYASGSLLSLPLRRRLAWLVVFFLYRRRVFIKL